MRLPVCLGFSRFFCSAQCGVVEKFISGFIRVALLQKQHLCEGGVPGADHTMRPRLCLYPVHSPLKEDSNIIIYGFISLNTKQNRIHGLTILFLYFRYLFVRKSLAEK